MANTYYIDYTLGNDSNDGLSVGNAWKTVDHVNNSSFSAGDSILFKCGEIWREQLTIPSSGSVGSPITFGNYGAGANPKIYRSDSSAPMWEEGLAVNGGFEVYTVGSNDSFVYYGGFGGWSSDGGTGYSIKAETGTNVTPHSGRTCVKLSCGNNDGGRFSGAGRAELYQTITIPAADGITSYTISAYGYRPSSSTNNNVLFCRIADNEGTAHYLDSSGGWQTAATTVCLLDWSGSATDTWVLKSQTFVPVSGVTQLTITFYNYGDGVPTPMPSYLDDVLIKRTTDTVKVWGFAAYPNTDYWGIVYNGSLVNQPDSYAINRTWRPGTGTTGYYMTTDNTWSSPWSCGVLLYRRDAGSPGTVEFGVRKGGIYISNKNYITVDGIDISGPGGSTDNQIPSGTGATPISNFEIYGTSDNIIYKNSDSTYSDFFGIYSWGTTTNVTYRNITSHDNAGMAIYNNSTGGGVYDCKAYNTALTIVSSDPGGIGSQGSDLTFSGNEVYAIGTDTSDDSDYGISIVPPGATGMVITGNYLHDLPHGAIQVTQAANGTIVAYNIIINFGYTSGTLPTYHGAGIRVGGGNDGCADVGIYNNVIAYGKATAATQAGVSVQNFTTSTGLKIKNNIFYNNDCQDIYQACNYTTGYEFTNNCYYGNTQANPWNWQGYPAATLSEWVSNSGGVITESGSIVVNPNFTNPSGNFSEPEDFQLQDASPCINGGVYVGLATDYAGISIIGNPDIGAWEYISIIYSRGDYTSLPADDADLKNLYSTQDVVDVSSDDGIRVSQSATGQYAIHEFKNDATNKYAVYLTWDGQTNIPCSTSTVYLQIYNHTSGLWENLDYDSTTESDTDFTLASTLITDLTDYKDGNNLISCRVYQLSQ